MTASAGREAVDRAADGFFSSVHDGDYERVREFITPDMSSWQSGGAPRVRFLDATDGIEKMRERMGTWEYHDARRITSDDGFCEQHVVRFTRPDGSTRDYMACVVAEVDADGRITRLDEYLDPSRESTWGQV